MNTVVTGYHGVLGGAVVEAELEQFSRSWRYGIEVLETVRGAITVG